MALKIMESVESVKDVNFLENVDVKKVSLVRHGANREPFKLVKRDNTGVDKYVHSVLVPNGIKISNICKNEGLEWLGDLKTDNVKSYKSYTEYEQQPEEDFKPESLEFFRLKEGQGVIAIVGEPTKGKDDSMMMPSGVMDVTVATETSEKEITAGEAFNRELSAFISSVQGAAAQSGYDVGQRSKNIMNAYKAFGGFLGKWCKAISDSFTGGKGDVLTNGGEDDMDENKVKEMIEEQTKETMKGIDEKFAELAAKMEELTSKKEEDKQKSPVELFEERMKEMQASLDELKGKDTADDNKGKDGDEVAGLKAEVEALKKAEEERKHALKTDEKSTGKEDDSGAKSEEEKKMKAEMDALEEKYGETGLPPEEREKYDIYSNIFG